MKYVLHSLVFFDNADMHSTQTLPSRTGTEHSSTSKNLLSGNAPYEASRRYSDELKATVRRCLAYSLEDRPTMQELREITRRNLEKLAPKKTTRSGKARSKPEDAVIIKVPEALQKFNVGASFDVPSKLRARPRVRGSAMIIRVIHLCSFVNPMTICSGEFSVYRCSRCAADMVDHNCVH